MIQRLTQTDEQTVGRMGETERKMNQQKDRRAGGRADRQMDGRTDGLVAFWSSLMVYTCICAHVADHMDAGANNQILPYTSIMYKSHNT